LRDTPETPQRLSLLCWSIKSARKQLPSHTTMQSLRRRLQSALLSASSTNHMGNGPRRAFSQSGASQRGTLPNFLESSTPELGAHLARINAQVLLPAHLTKEQQDLVYKPENRARLEAEPIDITLGEVTLPLVHMDRIRDPPNKLWAVREAVKQSKTAEDWENVVRLAAGYHDASFHFTRGTFEQVMRLMGEAGLHTLIVKSLQRANTTGWRLRDEWSARAVLATFHHKAADAAWARDATEQALRLAEQVAELLDDDAHMGGRLIPARSLANELPSIDPRASPFIIAVPLELAAVRAIKYQDGQDTDGKVLKYASRLLAAMKQDRFINQYFLSVQTAITVPLPPSAKNNTKNSLLGAVKTFMLKDIPFWNALRTSHRVLGANMPDAELATKLEKETRKALDTGLDKLRKANDGDFKTNYAHVEEAIRQCESV